MSIVPISEVRWRQHVTVEGVIQTVSVRNEYLNAAVMEVRIADSCSSIGAVFLGYRKMAGMKLGAKIKLTGLVINWKGSLMFLNPEYLLVPALI